MADKLGTTLAESDRSFSGSGMLQKLSEPVSAGSVLTRTLGLEGSIVMTSEAMCGALVVYVVPNPISSRWIAETNLPSRFVPLKFDLYDGMSDPLEHLMQYHHAIFPLGLPYDRREAIMCKIFVTSLKGVALTWFDSLKSESIHSFEELINHFGAQFASSMKVKKEAHHFFTITQGRNKSLKAYTQRFNKENVNILDCNESIVIEAFKKDLLGENYLYESLMKRVPETMIEPMSRAVKYINLEED
ncbi:uncharacterized protein LOC125418468 [Ziziphus jujuba]|uniref:Uncharacterized protein LOC125418468 n=1 Tax=Ziziphus jujuba TaxID=326968 RepID=A0ABM3I092_ZIZJJ|nr:uncharacterized protein LOC125418468 [Ziziphus jujuba]